MGKQYINFFVNSNNASLSNDGSQFSQSFDPILRIPAEAKNCIMYLHSADIWYNFQNISVSKNNNTFYFSDDFSNPSKYSFSISDGLYSLDMLNDAIKRHFETEEHPTSLFYFIPSDADGKVILYISMPGWLVFFGSSSPCDLLGLDKNDYNLFPKYNLTTGTNYYEKFQNVARFSEISSILFHTSLTEGIHLNGKSSSCLANIPISASPFDIMQFSPYNQIKINSNNIIGQVIYTMKIWITDQDNNNLNTNGEFYSGLIIIEYDL